jgi:hypothetical protein
MLDPLTRYLSGSCLKIYIGPFLLWLVVVLVATSYSHEEYQGLVLLSYISAFSLFALIVYLASNHEFETLQTYGVSFGRVALPVLAVALALQASGSAWAVIASNTTPRAIAYAAWTFLAVLVCCLTTLKTIWDRRDAGALRACLRGFAGQTSLLLVWGLTSLVYPFGHMGA